jgi:diadenosine tetraphosphate (Ap4A) HIT family hydrolase
MDTANAHAPINCCLCEEISSKAFPDQYRSTYPIGSRICHETGEFVILPTLSPLRAGHILILPRRHVTNLAALPSTERQALLACAKSAEKRLSDRFGSELYFFEHGVTGAGLACGIDHAHLHILPLSAATADVVESHIEADFPYQYASGLIEGLSFANQVEATSYLLRGTNLDSVRMSLRESIPSQYMRRLIVEAEGRNEWDWKMLGGRADFLSTCTVFDHA